MLYLVFTYLTISQCRKVKWRAPNDALNDRNIKATLFPRIRTRMSGTTSYAGGSADQLQDKDSKSYTGRIGTF